MRAVKIIVLGATIWTSIVMSSIFVSRHFDFTSGEDGALIFVNIVLFIACLAGVLCQVKIPNADK